MGIANLWSWMAGNKPQRVRRVRNLKPKLQKLEDRTVPNGYLAVGAGAGALPLVAIRVDKLDALTGSPPNPAGQPPVPGSDGKTDFTSQIFTAYDPRFLGGIHVTSGNFDGFMDGNGNGVDDRPDYLVTAPAGQGGPHVKVWEMHQDVAGNITVLRLVHEFMAYDVRFNGGVNLASGDLDGDGRSELIVGAGAGGGPHVKIYKLDFSDQRMVMVNEFMAYDISFRGGVSVAANQGYLTQVQYQQLLSDVHPDDFLEVPYFPPTSRPGFNADPALDIPLSGFTIDPISLEVVGYFTIASGNLQYVGGNLLNSFGNIAYEPNVVDPTGMHEVPPEQPLVYASWAEDDDNIPPWAIPEIVYGPLVQISPGDGDNPPVVQPFSQPVGQPHARNQLITGPGVGGGPLVRVWDFVSGGGQGFRLNEQIEFFAFDPADRRGINVAIGDVIELPDPDPTGASFVSPNTRPTGGPLSNEITFPYDTNVYRQFTAEIIVSTASGGFQSVVYSDYNPRNPFTGRPEIRTRLSDLNLVQTYLDTKVVFDPNNPLGGYQSLQNITLFERAIDPQFRGTIYTGASALDFSGTGNDITRAQMLFGAGANPNNGPSRGPRVRIFDDLGALPTPQPGPFSTPHNQPIDDFQAFLQGFFPTGVGGASFGFGTLPMPGLDIVVLTAIDVPETVDNPLFVPPN